MPVLVPEEVACQNVDLSLTRILSEANDGFHVTTFEQTFESLHLLVCHGVDFGTELEVTLSLDHLGDTKKNLNSFFLLHWVVSLWRDEFLCEFFFQNNVLLLRDV